MRIGPVSIGRPSPTMVVAIIALFLALGGSGYAALGGRDKKVVKRIVASQITASAPGLSVKHAGSADSAANAGHADTADSAAAVGGMSVQPVSIGLVDGPTSATVLNVNGSLVNVTCNTGSENFTVDRGLSSPPISSQWIRNALSPLVVHQGAGTSTTLGAGALGLTVTVRESTGRVTRLVVDSFYEPDALGGPEDCFIQGTIERFG